MTTLPSPNTSAGLNLSRWFFRLSVVCMVVGMTMGIAMGVTEDFTLMPAHAHLNLLGWVSAAIFGLMYRLIPGLAQGRWPWIHFGASIVGVVTMTLGLGFFLYGDHSMKIFVELGSMLTLASAVIFGILIFRRI